MRIPRSFSLAVLALAILFLPLPGHSQSTCNAVSNNPLVMQMLCTEPAKAQAVPATLRTSLPKPLELPPITAEAINHMQLVDVPPVRQGDVLRYEANRSDFILELFFGNGKEIVIQPLTQAAAENTEIRWKQGETKLDYPETLNQPIVRMRIRALHQLDAPLLLRAVKITRNGETLAQLQVTHTGPSQPPFEPPMSYPPDPMTPNPHMANVSVSKADLLSHQPQAGFLAPKLPSYSMNSTMFQSTTTSTGDPNHYKFQGKELDAETGLYNFGARYYNPALSRYMSPDWSARPTAVPYANLADPQTLNLYTFGRNNPISLPDLDGHDPGDKFKTKTAAAVDAIKYIRGKSDGYSAEYGTRIEKNGKVYTYQEPVTQQNPKGVDLPALQKNDVGDVHTHENNDPLANSIQQPDKLGTIADKNAVQKMQDDPNIIKVDYQSYVGAPNGDVMQFTPNPNAADGLGDTKVVQHNVAPDPNPPSRSQPQSQQPQPQSNPKPNQEKQ